MFKWFQNEAAANTWMQANGNWTMRCVAPGSISGSLTVGFVPTPRAQYVPPTETRPELTLDPISGPLQAAIAEPTVIDGHWGTPVSESSAWGDAICHDTPSQDTLARRRRGRPPKVKNA